MAMQQRSKLPRTCIGGENSDVNFTAHFIKNPIPCGASLNFRKSGWSELQEPLLHTPNNVQASYLWDVH